MDMASYPRGNAVPSLDGQVHHAPSPADPLVTAQPLQLYSGRSSRSGSVSSISVEESILSSANSVLEQKRSAPSIDVKPWRAFLRSVGLKFLADRTLRFKPRFSRIRRLIPERFRNGEEIRSSKEEVPKVILSSSRRLALVRAGVHIFPMILTIFLLLLNGITLLNGPPITTNAVFALQVAAKLHELTIVGSLTAIALDLLQLHMLGNGLSIGLLSAGLQMGSPSWLWTIDFISGAKSSIPARSKLKVKRRNVFSLFASIIGSKLFLFTTLIIFTGLASTVGPASALLFIPTQIWVAGAHSHFYIKGTANDLWPDVLEKAHTGPEFCSQSPLPMDTSPCMNGNWRNMLAVATSLTPVRPGYSVHIPAGDAWKAPPARMLSGSIRDPDTWTLAPHLSTASHMDILAHVVGLAFEHVGTPIDWKRRLRDFGGSRLDITTAGRFPIARTVCTDRTLVRGPQSKLSLPILDRNSFWHGKGSAANIDFATLGLQDWDALKSNSSTERQIRATWIPMPASFGDSSAMFIYLAQNKTATYAHTCAVDARWASGQTMLNDGSVMWAWDSQPGYQHFGPMGSPGNWQFNQRKPMFDPSYTPYYSNPIQVEKVWLDALTPAMPEATTAGNDLIMNSFEALLNQSSMPDIRQMESNDGDSGGLLEYLATLFFVNALTRIGLAAQLADPRSKSFNQELLPGNITNASFITGTELYPERDPSEPYTRAFFQEYKYGTAWAIADMGQWLSVALLCFHMLVALVHTLIVVIAKRSSPSWDSINELIVLAYNSVAKPGAFRNCSGGIEHSKTLEKKIRVGTRKLDDGGEQAEIVICDDDSGAGEVVPGRAYN